MHHTKYIYFTYLLPASERINLSTSTQVSEDKLEMLACPKAGQCDGCHHQADDVGSFMTRVGENYGPIFNH